MMDPAAIEVQTDPSGHCQQPGPHRAPAARARGSWLQAPPSGLPHLHQEPDLHCAARAAAGSAWPCLCSQGAGVLCSQGGAALRLLGFTWGLGLYLGRLDCIRALGLQEGCIGALGLCRGIWAVLGHLCCIGAFGLYLGACGLHVVALLPDAHEGRSTGVRLPQLDCVNMRRVNM